MSEVLRVRCMGKGAGEGGGEGACEGGTEGAGEDGAIVVCGATGRMTIEGTSSRNL
jgi:hypothetical protein